MKRKALLRNDGADFVSLPNFVDLQNVWVVLPREQNGLSQNKKVAPISRIAYSVLYLQGDAIC